MKKVSNILLKLFSVGVLLTLFAGALALVGYIVAMIIGGETATQISLFIYESYFPWVIRICSVSVGLGLIGMYLQKKKALVVNTSDEDEQNDESEKKNENNKKEMKALVLAGGVPQIALLNDLKERGITTILADYFENPVAKPYADIFYRESTLDIDAITRIAKEEKVDFIVTVCTDQALLTVAQVSEELGLPCYIDYTTARNVTNKSYMKDIFAQKDISTAKFAVMAELDDQQISHLQYPLIVKPVDCNSSKGVKKVANLEELTAAFADAVKMSRTKTAIVEEFIDGVELSVDVYVENGTAHVLSVSQLDKIPEDDKFVIFRSKSPENMTNQLKANIEKIAQQIADAFELKNSPMLIQMISDGENAYVLEFSARTGGGEKFIMIKKVSGFDVISAVVDTTLGNPPKYDCQRPEEQVFATEFIYCKPGVFDHLENFEQLQEQGVISDYYCFKSKGSEFDSISNSGDRVAGFSMVGKTVEELNEKHDIAVKQLRVIDSEGNNMMRYDLLPTLYN